MLFYTVVVFFFKQKTAYEMRISDWSSDVCSSDLPLVPGNTVTGTFDVADRTRFTLTLTQPSRLLFDALSSNTNLHWTLTGPRGVEVDQRTIAYSDSVDLASSLQPLMDLPAGDYVLTIGGFEAGGGAADSAFQIGRAHVRTP